MLVKIGIPSHCPRCNRQKPLDYNIHNGPMTQHIQVCGECYSHLHDCSRGKRWSESFWQQQFDAVVALHKTEK